MDRNLLPALGTVPLSKLKAGDLDRFYRKLSVDGGSRSGPLAPGTVRRIHGILRRALGQGMKWGWIGVNPAVATTPPRVPQPDINPPSSAEVARLLRRAAETSPELACFLMLSAATGARRSEIVALRWSDIDLSNRTVAISRGVVTGPDGLVEKDTKSHAARRLALDESAAFVLGDHAAHMRANAAASRITLADTAFVFSNTVDGSEPWYPDSVSRSFQRLCKQEGLTGVRLHDLRHFVASQLLSAGVDVRTVAGRLGHRKRCDNAQRLRPFPRTVGPRRRRCHGPTHRGRARRTNQSALLVGPPGTAHLAANVPFAAMITHCGEFPGATAR